MKNQPTNAELQVTPTNARNKKISLTKFLVGTTNSINKTTKNENVVKPAVKRIIKTRLSCEGGNP